METGHAKPELETLVAQMGITTDRLGRLRIVTRTGTQKRGTRWLSKEEQALIPAAVQGYASLPIGIQRGGEYSPAEVLRLAAAATDAAAKYGHIGVSVEPEGSSQEFSWLKASLEELLDIAGRDGTALTEAIDLVEYTWREVEFISNVAARYIYSAKVTLQIAPGVALRSAFAADKLLEVADDVASRVMMITWPILEAGRTGRGNSGRVMYLPFPRHQG